MIIRPHKKEESPPIPSPFPIHLYLVGVSDNGDEMLRYDLNCAFTAFGQTVHIHDPTLEILP
jgi:hypothetical protein